MATFRGRLAAQRARNARIMGRAKAIVAALPNAETDTAHVPVVLLPANTRPLVPLPASSRGAFLSHLDAVLTTAFAEPRPEPLSTPQDEANARADAGDAASWDASLSLGLVGAACGTCRGACCTAGGTHAFLNADSLSRIRTQQSTAVDDTREAIRAQYVAALPRRHYRDSCVFHTTGGCALPRAIRSSLCNRYQCGGLTQLSRALSDAGTKECFVAAADSSRLRRMARISDDGAVPIPISTRPTRD